ncbi:MAG: SDR family NAD(P)-dependent oxidoreductase [Candidatus Hydrogenedentes bacterium]|nr:SDR family NAD(P)-dependent oxidoreductase [Candidatus Hydrogenedentota bacterium]
MTELGNKIALVTGASSGIGAAIALGLARAGARVGLAGRNLDRLTETAAAAGEFSPQVHRYQADLTQMRDLYSLKAAVNDDFGGLDVIVHAAGAFRSGRIEQGDPELLMELFRINTWSPYALTHLFLPVIRQRRGSVVFINSRAGLRAPAGLSQYAASKFALRAIADVLRAEVSPDGVRVITLYPGKVATPMQEQLQEQAGRPYFPDQLTQAQDVAELVLTALRMPPTTELSDVIIQPQQDPYSG